MHLALIATVPSVSLVLLPQLLETIRSEILQKAVPERKGELVDALFKEILENVGDQEKEYAMRWWYDQRDTFGVEPSSSSAHDVAKNHNPTRSARPDSPGTADLVSRL